MTTDLYAALAAGWLAVLGCDALPWLQRFRVFQCSFCTTFWASAGIVFYMGGEDRGLRTLAVAAAANVVVLLIRFSMTLFGETE